VRLHRDHVDQERDDGHRQRQPQDRPALAPCKPQQQRPEDVELLLDPQRPQVQQRLGLGRGVEVARFAEEHQVGEERGTARGLLAELRELARQQHVPAECQRGEQHQHQRGKDAPDAPRIEVAVGEIAGREALQKDGRDQETRDHEEDVDADEAAGQQARKGVVRQHRAHRDGAQAVNVRAVLGMHRSRGRAQREGFCGSAAGAVRTVRSK
jgi:hypothetical protein